MKTTILLTALLFVAGLTCVGRAQSKTDITCGNSTTGQNGIPFGGLYNNKVYQQICTAALFPAGAMAIEGLSFTSNPAAGTGTAQLNVTIRLAETWFVTTDPATNLGQNWQMAYNGPITARLTGQPGDLTFNFQGKPFVYNPANGNLVVQIEVWQSSFGGFLFGTSPFVWRVYQNLSTNAWSLENAGLTMTVHAKLREPD